MRPIIIFVFLPVKCNALNWCNNLALWLCSLVVIDFIFSNLLSA
jgi:hypothetical protein